MSEKQQVPLLTCIRKSCDGCELRDRLLCVADYKDIIDFCSLWVVFIISSMAGMIIGQFWLGIAVWLALAVIFFGYVEVLVLCRHCPHYGEKGFLLRCHAEYGMPKIHKFSPKPMTKVEQAVWLLSLGIIFLWYVPFFVVSGQWLLLLITSSALFAAVWTLLRTQCNRCYHLSCPINRTPPEIREKFYRNYPVFDRARKR